MTEPPSTEDWRRIEVVLGEALARSGQPREVFLDEACSGNAALRREVTSLLDAHERSGLLDALAVDIAPLAAGLRSTGDGGATESANDREHSTLLGRTIGQYRVVSHLGDGGMGVVYEGVDTRLDRTVALKFLRPHLTNDRHARRRFDVEARAAAALDHPNICTVYEIGTTDGGERFLAMPLYVGETLHERLTRGPLAIADAVAIAVQIARGLAKAHEAGIVHRDIKPSNIFITRDGVVKILDFGIAKLVDEAFTLTGKGVLGTPAYMSPEQVRGERIRAGTDVWAVGVVLFEMLTAERPFRASGAAILAKIAYAEPNALSTYGPDIPRALEALVQRAMSKNQANRQASARELERELLALGVSGDGTVDVLPPRAGVEPSSPGRRTRRARLLLGAGALVLLAAIWGIVYSRRSPGAPPRATTGAIPTVEPGNGAAVDAPTLASTVRKR